MECHRQLGCTEEELRTRLSRHLDGETRGSEAEAIEEHLKECARCRDELASLRGVDRSVAHAVSTTHARTGFVARVMEAMSRRRPSGRQEGKAVPRLLVWAIIAVAAPGLGVLAVFIIHGVIAKPPEPLREIDLYIGEATGAAEGALPARWRMRRAGEGEWTDLAPGAKLAAGTEVALDAGGGHGFIARKDSLRIYLAAGAAIAVDDEARADRGCALMEGRLLLVHGRAAMAFILALPRGDRLLGIRRHSRVLVEVCEGKTRAVKGSEGLSGPWGSMHLGAGFGAVLAPGRPVSGSERVDLRAIDVSFAPSRYGTSPWPEIGGSSAREGNSPYELSLPPRKVLGLEGISGASAPVIGADGTLYFLAGPAPGRLVGVKGGKRAVSVPVPDPSVGDPAIAPDGSVLVATRVGLVRYRPGRDGFESVARLEADEIPNAGPMVGRNGAVYVVSGRGLAAYGSDGRLLWRRTDLKSNCAPSAGVDGEILVASMACKLHALDPETGRDRSAAATPVDEPFLAHVAVAHDGTAYAVSSSRYLVWRSVGGASGRVALPAAEYVLAPAIAPSGEVVVASSAGAVYRLPPRPAQPPKTPFFDAGEGIRRGPLVGGGGRIIVWTVSGKLVAVEKSGRPRAWELGVRDCSPGAVSRDGALFFVTRDGRLFGR
ncbi:MAG: zf-HC2 domain-containing protein [Planctomycetota bacterium]|jgi:outer membrane protein assembly factor BamB